MYKKKTMEYPKPEPIIPMMLDGEITPYIVSKSSTATTKEIMPLSQNQKLERLSEVRDLTPQEN
jgi:hypothetical protein